uniref:Putative endoribonuclease L-PSP n=1 Tax=uncultured marine microorganism HF4000_ANIW93N21 TaxID=455527 RepID=B3T347_9ZZZZ|nr:putative endoribonuclease L-PSP [uncultured marine microorganism HF4000_ANIW93N21]
MEIIRRDYPDMPQPAGAFHHSVRFGNMLFIAGSTARGTAAETGDIAAQTEVILQKFQTILEANCGSMSSIVKITSFVTDLREAPASGEVRRKYFEGNFPASTQVQIAALGTPDLKIEIEAIAVLPD